MTFASFLKSTLTNVVNGAGSSRDSGVCHVIGKKLLVASPPEEGLFGGVLLGRTPEKVIERIRAEGGPRCLLVDLCDRPALTALHEGPIASFCNDGGTPPLQLLWSIVAAITLHLATHPGTGSVCLLLDTPSEGKAGTAVICYALYSNLFSEDASALRWYKTQKRPAVSFTPSQERYISYFSRSLEGGGPKRFFRPPKEQTVLIRGITLRRVPYAVASRAQLVLEVEHLRAVYAEGDPLSNQAKTLTTIVHSPGDAGIISDKSTLAGMQFVDIGLVVRAYVEDDFRISLWSVNDFRRREQVCAAQLHTSFLFDDVQPSCNGRVLCLSRSGVDGGDCLGSDFRLEVDIVKENRAEPMLTEEGSMIIVDQDNHNQQQRSQRCLTPRAQSPVSLGASTIARIPSQDLLGGSSMMELTHMPSSGTPPTSPLRKNPPHHHHHSNSHSHSHLHAKSTTGFERTVSASSSASPHVSGSPCKERAGASLVTVAESMLQKQRRQEQEQQEQPGPTAALAPYSSNLFQSCFSDGPTS